MEIKDNKIKEPYYFTNNEGKLTKLPEKRVEDVDILDGCLDGKKDHFISDEEISAYYGLEYVSNGGDKKFLEDFKLALEEKGKEIKDKYPSYEEVVKDLLELEKKYPDLAKVVKLNDKPTADGHDVFALKISKGVQQDTGNRPGVVITGVHHAREWAGEEVSRNTAHYLLENYADDEQVKRRVDNAEIWIVPLVNPDGYEYSREEFRYWRKNREPFEKDGQVTYGLDPNRNYWDGKPEHLKYYRIPADTPESYTDDYGGDDNPKSDFFRGTKPNSTEVKAMVDLEVGKDPKKPTNIRGVINYHAVGKEIMYPRSFCSEPSPMENDYKEICNHMNTLMGNKYDVLRSSDLYPSTGSSDVVDADGIMELTLEVGNDNMFPTGEALEEIKKDTNTANNYFIDWIIDHPRDTSKPKGYKIKGLRKEALAKMQAMFWEEQKKKKRRPE